MNNKDKCYCYWPGHYHESDPKDNVVEFPPLPPWEPEVLIQRVVVVNFHEQEQTA